MHRCAARRDPVFPGHQVLCVLRREGWRKGETANRAPREAGGLFSVFAALNEQLYIPIEAEESLWEAWAHFWSLGEGKKVESPRDTNMLWTSMVMKMFPHVDVYIAKNIWYPSGFTFICTTNSVIIRNISLQ